jgi:hypothetical protein
METLNQIKDYISSISEPKQSELQKIHQQILNEFPNKKLWFLDGKNTDNKIVSNPNIGYGTYLIQYANGKSKEFYRIGLSANTEGISVYIMGLEDKNFLNQTYGKTIGKAKITGYCIKFKSLEHINLEVLLEAIRKGINL